MTTGCTTYRIAGRKGLNTYLASHFGGMCGSRSAVLKRQVIGGGLELGVGEAEWWLDGMKGLLCFV
jgi:hypothetical protein